MTDRSINLLVVDDQLDEFEIPLRELLATNGFSFDGMNAFSVEQTLQHLQDSNPPAVLLLDVLGPGDDPGGEDEPAGLRLYRKLEKTSAWKEMNGGVQVVLFSQGKTEERDTKAWLNSTLTFRGSLHKDELLAGEDEPLNQLRHAYRVAQTFLRRPPWEVKILERFGIVFHPNSRQMWEVQKSILAAGQCDVPVLIRGESGTGKELVARAIYEVARRKKIEWLKAQIEEIYGSSDNSNDQSNKAQILESLQAIEEGKEKTKAHTEDEPFLPEDEESRKKWLDKMSAFATDAENTPLLPGSDRFVACNIGAMDKTLQNSELFGAEQGAYTGSESTRLGWFEYSSLPDRNYLAMRRLGILLPFQGSTLFLDEIGDATKEVQTRLLRVLQEKTIFRLGAMGNAFRNGRAEQERLQAIAAARSELGKALEDIRGKAQKREGPISSKGLKYNDLSNLTQRFYAIAVQQEVLPIGDVEKRLLFRLITATNRDLEEMVNKGDFRDDLYHRINAIVITMPPLREREDDIVLLAQYFLSRHNDEAQRRQWLYGQTYKKKSFHKDVPSLLKKYSWKNNVRELRNVVAAAYAATTSTDIELPHLIKEKILADIDEQETSPKNDRAGAVVTDDKGIDSIVADLVRRKEEGDLTPWNEFRNNSAIATDITVKAIIRLKDVYCNRQWSGLYEFFSGPKKNSKTIENWTRGKAKGLGLIANHRAREETMNSSGDQNGRDR